MKKIALFFSLLLLCVTGVAQSVNIHKVDGEMVRFAADGVASVSFIERIDTIKIHGIDFNVPSGLLWADMNVGATSLQEYGLYYAWGDTVGHKKDETPNFLKTNYKWYDGEGNPTKYCMEAENGFVDNKNTLDPEDDPVRAVWGGDWRMPTKEEFEELLNYSFSVWSSEKGVAGIRLRGVEDPGCEIFLPAVGSYEGSELKSEKITGRYWCSTLSDVDSRGAGSLFFLKTMGTSSVELYTTSRSDGLCIRPVCSKKEGGDATTCIPIQRRYYVIKKTDGATQEYREDEVLYIDFTEGLSSMVLDGYEAIDLGLPSGLKWASMNVGAEKQEDYGLYFQWGDTVGKTQEEVYATSWSNYKWCENNPNQLTKYCTKIEYGSVDNKKRLDSEDDAAQSFWKGEWRMPTKEDIQELIDNTTREWTTVNGVYGMIFISKVGDASIFLPAAGCGDGVLLEDGEVGLYWSSSLYEGEDDNAYLLYVMEPNLDYGYDAMLVDYYRCVGMSVRAVHP